ncbi:leucine-rich repeat protein [Treponema sp. OMZ 803]|uniref:leucine-rich repeat protein n=1 Tax=Treponema sp. OMZ 803 TaxID=120682 RepID=UPI0020A3D5CB|nr:leucine-rich repeat protein [Treponema sp. OMZ 803]UTC54076.1 leucine-rich repeat protein [Treponema sp. OMZ 803]
MKTIHKKNTTFLNLAAAALMVAALVLGCKPNVSNGGEVQPPVTDGCTITMSAGANGSITANPVIPAGGKVAKDAEITFTATANPGYRVDTWTITGGTIQAGGQQGNTTAKVKVTANTTVNVTFKSTAVQPPTPPVTDGCTVTMSAGANGSITANPVIPAGGKVAKDAEITFTATANPGYRVDTWAITGGAIQAGGQQGDATAKVKVTANTTVNVTFKAIKYPVTMTHGEHGDITANMSIPAKGIDYGTEITFTATANPGYRVDTWTITGGTIQAGGQQGNTTAKVKVIADTTVNVTFKPIVYTPVAYADLPNHLTTAQPESGGIYYIEITDLMAIHVKGDYNSASPLGQILRSNKRKKVALKFGTMPYVTDMRSCFNGCTSLVQVSDIPNSVTDMYSCFSGCTKLERVPNIPDSVTNMSFCFDGCTKLEYVPNIPDGVTDMDYCFSGCTKLEQVPNIPDGVTDMEWCFNGCTSLTSVPNIPDSVTNMHSCFKGCTKLEQVPNIPNSVTNMRYCFGGCTKLVQVTNIPDGVTDMFCCFEDCTSLTSVTLKCGYLDGKFDYAFDGCRSLSAGSIKVPADSLDDYKDNAGKMKAKAEWFAKDE